MKLNTNPLKGKYPITVRIAGLCGIFSLVLIFLVVCTVLMIFIDAGTISFTVEEKWTDLLQLVLITVIGAYFGGRSFEKRKK